jgi:hypothetical protein
MIHRSTFDPAKYENFPQTDKKNRKLGQDVGYK